MAGARAKRISTYGVYFVQGFAGEDALDYGGILAGQSFPELTNGDCLDGKSQEDFLGGWLSAPWDRYLERARATHPALRVVFVELSKKLPFGRKLPQEPTPSWVENAHDWGKAKIDGVDIGIDVLDPPSIAPARIREHLFTHPLPELAPFRARLNQHGLFTSFEDASEFIAAAQKLNLRYAPKSPWTANRVYWLRSLEGATPSLWQPDAS